MDLMSHLPRFRHQHALQLMRSLVLRLREVKPEQPLRVAGLAAAALVGVFLAVSVVSLIAGNIFLAGVMVPLAGIGLCGLMVISALLP